MIALDIEAPEAMRASVAFNGDVRGVLILAAKAREDARNFRWIAELIRKGAFGAAEKPNAERAAGALASLADQFEMAADGRNPQAR
jgi:alkyl sulfatase BDS1-like metallo-beta-lactamase superfamily hydrolase